MSDNRFILYLLASSTFAALSWFVLLVATESWWAFVYVIVYAIINTMVFDRIDQARKLP